MKGNLCCRNAACRGDNAEEIIKFIFTMKVSRCLVDRETIRYRADLHRTPLLNNTPVRFSQKQRKRPLSNTFSTVQNEDEILIDMATFHYVLIIETCIVQTVGYVDP